MVALNISSFDQTVAILAIAALIVGVFFTRQPVDEDGKSLAIKKGKK
jgi:hypothetical protein